MDKQFLEKAILVHVYVPDGGSGYKLHWDFACEAYVLHIITHILCRSGEEAVKKGYAKKVSNVLPSHSFEITTKGLTVLWYIWKKWVLSSGFMIWFLNKKQVN